MAPPPPARYPGSRAWRDRGEGDFQIGYLDCIAEAARRGVRELERLHAAAGKIAALPRIARSHVQAADAVALREPLVTGRLLACRLDITTRAITTSAGLDLAGRLIAAGVLREMTGRAAWRAFAIA